MPIFCRRKYICPDSLRYLRFHIFLRKSTLNILTKILLEKLNVQKNVKKTVYIKTDITYPLESNIAFTPNSSIPQKKMHAV